MRNELDQAKRDWEKAGQALQNALLDLTPHQGGQHHPVRSLEAWQALYYAQPNVSQAAKSLYRKLAALRGAAPEVAAKVDSLVNDAIAAANRVCALRSAPRQPRERAGVSQYGSAYNGSWAATLVAPEAIAVGNYLVLTYGNGHQLAYVAEVTGERGLIILRLKSRGYTYARWERSWISRFDVRIQGLGSPVPSDPPLEKISRNS